MIISILNKRFVISIERYIFYRDMKLENKVKILLWGIDSPWTKNFIENFLLNNNYEVWILDRSCKKEHQEYIEFYKRKGVHIIEFPELISNIYDGKEKGDYFKILYGKFLQLKTILKTMPYDIINMQYVEGSDLVDVVILKYLMKSKLILSYWGSDLFRVETRELISRRKYVKHADFITFDSLDLERKFKKVYKWTKEIPSRVVLLGLPVLDIISKYQNRQSVNSIRKKWGILDEKIVIAIGYNGIPQQQHKKVLHAIRALEERYKEKIVILLQMTYGGSKIYRKSVIKAVEETGFEYIVIQSFLSNNEVAELRIMTDIFINAQTTDAFSGSVCEYLFADSVVINAKWLCYKEFEKYDFQYLEFENFDELHLLIKQVMEQKIEISKNKRLVWRLRSWEQCASKWEKVYKRMCKSC